MPLFTEDLTPEAFAIIKDMAKALSDSLWDFWQHHPKYRWECHGLGMAFAYLTPDVRLHVWDKRFRHPGRWDESIHSHRWALWSTVLHGSLIQQEFEPVDAVMDGTHVEWSVANSTWADPHALVIVNGRKLTLRQANVRVSSGEYYSMLGGNPRFHRTEALDGTVTLMRRNPETKNGLSSCLIPVGVEPKHVHDWDTETDLMPIVNKHLRNAGLL